MKTKRLLKRCVAKTPPVKIATNPSSIHDRRRAGSPWVLRACANAKEHPGVFVALCKTACQALEAGQRSQATGSVEFSKWAGLLRRT